MQLKILVGTGELSQYWEIKLVYTYYTVKTNQSINQSNYFIVRLKVDQKAVQLSLPHLGITKTEK